MTTVNVKLGDLPARMIADLRLTERDAKRALYRAAVRGIRRVTEEIDSRGSRKPVDRGTFRASWKALPTEDGAVLFSDAPHADFLERGTRPHMPNLMALMDWVKRKFKGELAAEYKQSMQVAILTSALTRKDVMNDYVEFAGMTINKRDYVELAAARVALAIGRKIKAHGTPPLHILQNSIPDIERLAIEELQRVCDARS